LVAAWLGLSQLHTLRGVSLTEVPAAAIAALPRLHTLHLNHTKLSSSAFPVAAVFDEVLPRLRSFRLVGTWPEPRDGTEVADVPSLPRLEDLKWCGSSDLPRQFTGARPSTLFISGADLVTWLKATDGAVADSSTVTSPLACVRALTVRLGIQPPLTASMAWLLREAPQLRQLTFRVFRTEHTVWVLSHEAPSESAFAGLVHPRLRHVVVSCEHSESNHVDVPAPGGCGARLRQQHFPRLRRLTVDDEEYPVWVPRGVRRHKAF
jgi:hypothetical protein